MLIMMMSLAYIHKVFIQCYIKILTKFNTQMKVLMRQIQILLILKLLIKNVRALFFEKLSFINI